MRLNLYASLPHYAEHLWPIWQALPERLRGAAWSSQDGSWWGSPLAGLGDAQAHPGPVLVASYGDAHAATTRGRELVYVEHGAGQTYGGDPAGASAAGLAGGGKLERVRLFICPNETVADRWRTRYQAPAVAVGCPKMDWWLQGDNRREDFAGNVTPGGLQGAGAPPKTVAVTFHWDSGLVPETQGAWPAYDHVLPELAAWCEANGVRLLGHGHPRIWPRIARRWEALGVDPVRQLGDVFAGADVLVADNTSAMYEFASLDRPVIAVNAPWFRRDVEHGLRFWSHVPGLQVDDPANLIASIDAHLRDRTQGEAFRRRAVAAAYAHTDGLAAERAAHAITEALE